MHRYIDGEDRMQQALLPHSLEDYVGEENPVRVIEVFIDELDLAALGFSGMTPSATGRPAYHPSTLLKIYLLRRRPASALARLYMRMPTPVTQDGIGTARVVRGRDEHLVAIVAGGSGSRHRQLMRFPADGRA